MEKGSAGPPQGAPPNEAGSDARPGWYKHEGESLHWDGAKWDKRWSDPSAPGWHRKEGTLRYFDGSSWTEHIAPPSPTTAGIAGAVCVGILAALFIVWLGAQISPEHVYLPVKFVVKELR